MILSNKRSLFCSRLFYLFYEPSRLCQPMRTVAAMMAAKTTTPMTRQAKHNHHLASSLFSPRQMFDIVMLEADDTVFLCDIFLLWQAWNTPPPPSSPVRKKERIRASSMRLTGASSTMWQINSCLLCFGKFSVFLVARFLSHKRRSAHATHACRHLNPLEMSRRSKLTRIRQALSTAFLSLTINMPSEDKKSNKNTEGFEEGLAHFRLGMVVRRG